MRQTIGQNCTLQMYKRNPQDFHEVTFLANHCVFLFQNKALTIHAECLYSTISLEFSIWNAHLLTQKSWAKVRNYKKICLVDLLFDHKLRISKFATWSIKHIISNSFINDIFWEILLAKLNEFFFLFKYIFTYNLWWGWICQYIC